MKNNKLIDKLFLIIVSIQTILMGSLFIVQVLRIYYGNNREFTREICGQYILEILPVIILWGIVIIVSYIYFYIKGNPNKSISKISNVTKLKNLERICPDLNDIETKEQYDNEINKLEKEKKNRKVSNIISIVIVIICSLMGIGYLVNVKHFQSNGDLTQQAIQMSIHLSPWVIISFISLICNTLYNEYSSKKSIDFLKMIISQKGKGNKKYTINKKEQLVTLIAQLSILTIAVVLIIVGIFNGGATDVLQKAVNICTECIGLG